MLYKQTQLKKDCCTNTGVSLSSSTPPAEKGGKYIHQPFQKPNNYNHNNNNHNNYYY